MRTYRFLALGDSYTIGEGVLEKDRWPNQVVDLLDHQGLRMEVTIIARTGWTVDELWEGIQANPPAGTYDMVTLLIGANDQYLGYPPGNYREDFRFMLGNAIEYAGGDPKKVIVLSIPDWGTTPFADGWDKKMIRRQINEFNAINREESQAADVYYVDVTEISRMAKHDLGLVAQDSLHPSGRMYTMWAEKVLPFAREVLK